MSNLDISKILVTGAKLESKVLNVSTERVASVISETKQRQKDVLAKHAIDQEKLKKVVQL